MNAPIIREHMQGTALSAVQHGQCIGTAKRTPRGWTVRSRVGHAWTAPQGAICAGRPTDVYSVGSKAKARALLLDLAGPEQ